MIGGVDLVPYLDLRDGLGRIALPAILRAVRAERIEDCAHIVILRFAVGMDDVAHMNDQVGGGDFLKRRTESGDELGRQVGHKADRVGQDRLVDAGQPDFAHRRIERGEKHIFRHDVTSSQPIEKS